MCEVNVIVMIKERAVVGVQDDAFSNLHYIPTELGFPADPWRLNVCAILNPFRVRLMTGRKSMTTMLPQMRRLIGCWRNVLQYRETPEGLKYVVCSFHALCFRVFCTMQYLIQQRLIHHGNDLPRPPFSAREQRGDVVVCLDCLYRLGNQGKTIDYFIGSWLTPKVMGENGWGRNILVVL